jgi:ubiquitin carboxyl-terminal hydrolase 5/13
VASHCANCDLKENLWLCLTCGNVGCGRKQYGGLDGHGHGLKHYEDTGKTHSIAVKLGTITSEGEGDVFCYADGDSVLDPLLAIHLQALGLSVATSEKTVVSTTELNIQQNLSYEFSLLSSTGENLTPVFGPGLTGLQNLGNSCYMASTLQVLFSLPPFRRRYLPTATLHSMICPLPLPAECVDCQMHKLADGLLSGRYAVPRTEPDPAQVPVQATANDPVFQEGLRPTSFKHLVGKGHAEFATMRQQDAEEFLGHLLSVLRAHHRKTTHNVTRQKEEDGLSDEPTEILRFGVESKLKCASCGGVRYRVDESDVASVPVEAVELAPKILEDGKEEKVYQPVEFMRCIEGLMGEESLEYKCPGCGVDGNITK